MTGLMVGGVAVNDDLALSISTVNRCVQILADAVSTLEFSAYKRTTDRTIQKVDYPLTTLPWPEGTLVDFLAQVMFSITLRGNFYGLVVDRDPVKGWPLAVNPIHPDDVMARRGPDGFREYRVKGRLVNRDDIIHIPSSMVPPGGFVGLNPVEYMRTSWGLAASTERYGGMFFANSATPSGILTTDGDLSPEETLELAREWRQVHGGLLNAQYPAVLTGGLKFQQISISPDDAQFLATRQFQRHDIQSWFGIPPSMMGDQDRSTAVAGNEQFEMSFVTNTLRPYIVRIEAAFDRITPPKLKCRFDFTDRLRADTLTRFQAHQLAINTGIKSINEVREYEQMTDIGPKGDVHLQPMNMAPLGTAPANPGLKPTNDAGVGQGGGNPANSPKETTPDKPS